MYTFFFFFFFLTLSFFNTKIRGSQVISMAGQKGQNTVWIDVSEPNEHHCPMFSYVFWSRQICQTRIYGGPNLAKGCLLRIPDLRWVEWVHCLFLVSPCFRENVVVICKIGSFLCSLDNLLQKNIIFFFEHQISKWRSFEKGLFLTYFLHFLVTRGKLQKFLQHISHSHRYMYFAHPLDLFALWFYHVWFLFGMIPGVDSYSRHFGTINK